MTDKKQPIAWAEIERDFRSSPMSIREIANWYGISEAAIRKNAKAGEWTRDHPSHSARPEPANPEPQIEIRVTPLTAETTSPEAIVGRGRNLVLRMMDELEATTNRLGELEDIITMAIDGADGEKQREAMRQAVSLKQRSEVLKSLSLAAKTFAESGAPAGVKAQRQAAGEKIAKGGGKFAAPAPPKLVIDNR